MTSASSADSRLQNLSLQVGSGFKHPLDPLDGEEIARCAHIVRNVNSGNRLIFKIVSLLEPPKEELIPYLKAENAGFKTATRPTRKAFVRFYLTGQNPYFEAKIDLNTDKLISQIALPGEFHARVDWEAVTDVADVALASDLVKKEVRRLRVPVGSKVVCEPWIYGTDSTDVDEPFWQCYFYLQTSDHPNHNVYAHPLDFSCIVDIRTDSVTKIQRLPLTTDPDNLPSDQDTYHGTRSSEYDPELLDIPLRKDCKPIVITQPEGPSFTVDGNIVYWQKFKFHLGFNYREGPVLNNVLYDGRPIFYRLSLSEMVVPYGDPRNPYHRKAAFDLGDNGAGACANNLRLGCDCLGVIKYFDGWINNQRGEPQKLPNAVCMHEVDNGVGWKHYNYRSEATSVVRNRELHIQTIITVANYEYIFNWILNQAGEISFEIRATGILSTVPMSGDITHTDFGIAVSKGTFAANHQHIFNLRIDPAIDGYEGTHFSYEDTVATPWADTNPHGVGYKTVSVDVERPGSLDSNPHSARIIKISNKGKLNPIVNKPVAYQLTPANTQLLLAHPKSFHAKRAEFAEHAFWFTKHRDHEFYAGSEHTNQSKGGHGIRSWAARNEALGDQGVLWHSFGFSHNPRLEDWPVMPVEMLRVHLKPLNFFLRNPALDVPPSNKDVNKSVLYEDSCC